MKSFDESFKEHYVNVPTDVICSALLIILKDMEQQIPEFDKEGLFSGVIHQAINRLEFLEKKLKSYEHTIN